MPGAGLPGKQKAAVGTEGGTTCTVQWLSVHFAGMGLSAAVTDNTVNNKKPPRKTVQIKFDQKPFITFLLLQNDKHQHSSETDRDDSNTIGHADEAGPACSVLPITEATDGH